MKITTEHAASSYGIPVILGDDGEPMDYALGVRTVRRRLGLTTAALGAACGRSGRTVEHWEQGRRGVPTGALLVMGRLLAASRRRERGRRDAGPSPENDRDSD